MQLASHGNWTLGMRDLGRYLEERRDSAVVMVIEALGPLAQPELLETQDKTADVIETSQGTEATTTSLLAPMPALASRR